MLLKRKTNRDQIKLPDQVKFTRPIIGGITFHTNCYNWRI